MKKMQVGEDCPNEYWKLFFEKIYDVDSLEIKQYKPFHVLGFFCKEYKKYYERDYQFKFNTEMPMKSFEMFHINRLKLNLSKDPEIQCQYIGWIFSYICPKMKRGFSSISFINNENVMRQFKEQFLSSALPSSLERGSKLDTWIIDLFKDTNRPIQTYGELALIVQYEQEKFKDQISNMKDKSFNFDILKRIV